MRILITRPEPDASEMRAALEALGHEVTIDSVMDIEALPIAQEDVRDARALIVTSRNALRTLAGSPLLESLRPLPVFAVGPGSAELARALDFGHVIEGEGTGRDLVPEIEQRFQPGPALLLHLAGETVAFDIAAALSAHGYNVRKITVYRTVTASALSPETVERLAAGLIDAVILMSPRAAATFAQLVRTADINESASGLTYLCLSRNVADALGAPTPARLEIAAMPNSAAMLAAVARVATQFTGV
jgi:uroporphyrinogen-III synthase